MKHIGRKLYHMAGGMGLLSAYYLLGRDKALMLYGALFILVLILEVFRRSVPAFNNVLFAQFQGFLRPEERTRMTGTAPYILGIALPFMLYRTDIAAAAVCFLAFGDVAATTVGERWGRTKIGKKSLEGTTAFVCAAVISGFLLSAFGIHLSPHVIVAGAVIAAVVEALPLPVNDNLVIPLVSGGAMELIVRYPGS